VSSIQLRLQHYEFTINEVGRKWVDVRINGPKMGVEGKLYTNLPIKEAIALMSEYAKKDNLLEEK